MKKRIRDVTQLAQHATFLGTCAMLSAILQAKFELKSLSQPSLSQPSAKQLANRKLPSTDCDSYPYGGPEDYIPARGIPARGVLECAVLLCMSRFLAFLLYLRLENLNFDVVA